MFCLTCSVSVEDLPLGKMLTIHNKLIVTIDAIRILSFLFLAIANLNLRFIALANLNLRFLAIAKIKTVSSISFDLKSLTPLQSFDALFIIVELNVM